MSREKMTKTWGVGVFLLWNANQTMRPKVSARGARRLIKYLLENCARKWWRGAVWPVRQTLQWGPGLKGFRWRSVKNDGSNSHQLCFYRVLLKTWAFENTTTGGEEHACPILAFCQPHRMGSNFSARPDDWSVHCTDRTHCSRSPWTVRMVVS